MANSDFATPWHSSVDGHYENFPVGSWLLPRPLRPAVAAIYRFARYADDVADEGEHPAQTRIGELNRLGHELDLGLSNVPGNVASHPVVLQLLPYLGRHNLEPALFHDLLSAFTQDVSVTRYRDYTQLLDYCQRSAAPIGRLMLQLFQVSEPSALRHSDSICNALQLINFLQDSAIDWSKGRLYLPADELTAAGLSEEMIAQAVDARQSTRVLCHFLQTQAERVARLLESGTPLIRMVPGRLAWELRAIVAGGRRILAQLEAGGYDPFRTRPRLTAADALPILWDMISRKPAA